MAGFSPRRTSRKSASLLPFLGVMLLVAVLESMAAAQSVSPAIVEYKGKARGKFQIANGTLEALNVVLEPFSFSVDGDGNAKYRPLDRDIHVRLSSYSFRIAPKQSFTVFYEATAERLPAWFTVYATLSAGKPKQTGFQIALKLPHTVYLLGKGSLRREEVAVLRAGRAAPQTVEAEVENRSRWFTRVKGVEVIAASHKQSYPGFPFFPGQRRRLQLKWEHAQEPQRMVVWFNGFKVEHPLQTGSTTGQ